MTLTLTPENIYLSIIFLLMVLQIYQWRQIFILKHEIKQLWDQISTFNTMVALKLLETQKEITNLKENKNGK